MNNIDDCEIHGCDTILRVLPVRDPMRATLKQSPAYLRARRTAFPYSDDVVAGRGIRTSLETARMPVCPECCRQRDRFLLANYPIWARSHDLAG
jgi:hypothetical protein